MTFTSPRISLWLKLIPISFILFIVPVVGIQMSEQIKRDLLHNRQQTLMFFAHAVASVLASQPELFSKERLHPKDDFKAIYMSPLHHPVRLNAKLDDWPEIDDMAETLAQEHLLSSSEKYDFNSFHALHMTGERGRYIYAFFKVTDDNIIYRRENSLWMDRSDHLQVHIEDKKGILHQYQITPRQPGWVNGYLYDEFKAAEIERRIQGVWEENEDGYTVEIRLPKEMVGNKLSFTLVDIDDEKERKSKYIISSNKINKNSNFYYYNKDVKNIKDIQNPGWIISPSTTITSIVKTLERPNFRITIVDANSRIRTTCGKLSGAAENSRKSENSMQYLRQLGGRLLAPLYRLFTKPFSNENIINPAPLSSFKLYGVEKALQGEENFTRYTVFSSADKKEEPVEVMAAAVPLKNGSTLVGAVAVEQTTNTILALQNRVIEETITVAIFAFLFGGTILVLFAFYLSSRIRRISRDAAGAISSSGQIHPIIPLQAKDEIGELSRTLAAMLNQLKSQTDFREKMADNLEHEIRTPLVGISTSLKNLTRELEEIPAETAQYIDWALLSVTRLETLLSDIRDATSLQEMLGRDQKENFSLTLAMEAWVTTNWQTAFSDVHFNYLAPQEDIQFYGDPQRILQLLDKLVENAVSFHLPQTTIDIVLEKKEKNVVIAVSNKGPTIPREVQGQIFNSMVSNRSTGSGKDDKAHLGLGLFIVRTIVEEYNGRVSVRSLSEEAKTTFFIELPL